MKTCVSMHPDDVLYERLLKWLLVRQYTRTRGLPPSRYKVYAWVRCLSTHWFPVGVSEIKDLGPIAMFSFNDNSCFTTACFMLNDNFRTYTCNSCIYKFFCNYNTLLLLYCYTVRKYVSQFVLLYYVLVLPHAYTPFRICSHVLCAV